MTLKKAGLLPALFLLYLFVKFDIEVCISLFVTCNSLFHLVFRYTDIANYLPTAFCHIVNAVDNVIEDNLTILTYSHAVTRVIVGFKRDCLSAECFLVLLSLSNS